MVSSKRMKVTLSGGGPWGFRLSGGGSMPLTVNKIRRKSQAHVQGLREGDAVISINGVPVHDKTQDEALEMVDKAGVFLKLEIFRGDNSEVDTDKLKKTIQVPGVSEEASVDKPTTSEVQVVADTDTSSDLVLTTSVETSDTMETRKVEVEEESFGELTMTATVDDVSGSTFEPEVSTESAGGLTFTASVDDMTSSTTATEDYGDSATFSAEVGDMTSSTVSAEIEEIQATAMLSTNMAEPFVDSEVTSTIAEGSSPQPHRERRRRSRPSPQPPQASPKPEKGATPLPQPSSSPQQPQTLSPQPAHVSPASQKSPSPQQLPRVSPQAPQHVSPHPPTLSPQPVQHVSPKPSHVSPRPQQSRSPQAPAVSPKPQKSASPRPPQMLEPQPPVVNHFAQPPTVSPKPQRAVSLQQPLPVQKPPGVTSSTATAVFDDGQTRREITREQHVQKSGDGARTTVVNRETTTTTSTMRVPVPGKNQASAFDAVQPSGVTQTQRSSSSTSTLKSTTSVISQKGPAQPQATPYSSSATASIHPPQQLQLQASAMTNSRSAGNLSGSGPVFKPSKFVPGRGKKEIPGLYTPDSPVVDVSVHAMYKDGKENVAPPQPMFHVTNIVSDKSKTSSKDIWRPNVWLPGQQPSNLYEEPSVATPKDDFSPYTSFPVPKIKPGYSLVEEQKRKLMEAQAPRHDYDDYYFQDNLEDQDQGHHKPERLHVFAPPVEIQPDSGYNDSPYSPYLPYSPDGEPLHMDEYEEGPSSPESSVIRRRKKIYADSAFYDTPGKNYPTIPEQMKLCKIIAQSLTSSANRRARGAKMFMKRKRKSSKWVHEGQSEWSSSAGDVANLHDLESELSPDEGGSKPLLYFKIPNLKNRVSSDAKQTKMALTKAQFEKLRLDSKKCDHRAVPPDTCFDIVADLKAHKGRGGRMFEKRKQRSDKFIVDDSNARHATPQARLESVLSQPVRQEKTPWEAAMEHGGNVDAAFSHLSEWERNQKLNQILKMSPTRKLQTTPLPPSVQAAPLPAVRSSLRSSDSPHILRGKNFNRTARGWGGGDDSVSHSLHHVSPTQQMGHTQSSHSLSQQQNYNTKIKAWQGPGESPYAVSAYQDTQQDQWDTRRQDEWQASRQDDWRVYEQAEPKQHSQHSIGRSEFQAPRPKSWQSDSYEANSYTDDVDYSYAPLDYKYSPSNYPTVAYMQPIIPGTDL